MTTPNTVHPWPRTSSRDRPNASPTPFSSSTITGTIRHHQVRRIRPGTISRISPMVMPIPASTPARISVHRYGRTRSKIWPTVVSTLPSRTSSTA